MERGIWIGVCEWWLEAKRWREESVLWNRKKSAEGRKGGTAYFCLALMRMGWGAARAPVVKARKTMEGKTENFIVLSVSSKRFGALLRIERCESEDGY